MTLPAGTTYWLVACSTAEQPKETIYSILRSRLQKHGLASDTAVVDIPMGLKFGTFDDLIRMADNLIKHDSNCEQIVRRLERQALDVDPNAELRIVFQRTPITFDAYLHRFSWDEAKYPKTRYMLNNIEVLMSSVSRIDEEIRVKAAAFNEIRGAHSQLSKKEATSYLQKDLVDVLTPDKVAADDFIETEHLTTAVAVVPTGHEETWLNNYEKLNEFVVPRSTKKFLVDPDKEGNTLWKVIFIKASFDAYKDSLRAKRITLREFKYKPSALSVKQEERSKLEAEKNKQETSMFRSCIASFSDACLSWFHIKAMRVFVEATLRFGVPPNFATFLIKPSPNKEKKLRKELEDIFTTKGMFGKAFVEDRHKSSSSSGADADNLPPLAALELGEEEYHPYVSLSITPFALFSQK